MRNIWTVCFLHSDQYFKFFILSEDQDQVQSGKDLPVLIMKFLLLLLQSMT